MLVQHRLELRFTTSHVQEPLTWEITRRFKGLMFNVDSLNVGVHDADMVLSLIGEPEEAKEAKTYLKDQGVEVKTQSSRRYQGKIPSVPMVARPRRGNQQTVEHKLWLTIIGSVRQEAFLWNIARRFDATYKIMQCASGSKVAIISLLVWGPDREVEGVVSYLRGLGINVEYGEVGVSAPFGPEG